MSWQRRHTRKHGTAEADLLVNPKKAECFDGVNIRDVSAHIYRSAFITSYAATIGGRR
jgi:hypothetical protein